MCGIFALFLQRPLNAADIALGRAGTAALAHRGPDGHGEFLDVGLGVYLGHQRLKVVDLSDGGAQPMRLDGITVSYNGEIYNFRELRKELEGRGDVFRSTSDTEVLLHAWRRWGERALDRFDGMFAFALWDGFTAHLAVDAFGEKPLYVANLADGLCVSSELAVLVRLLGLEAELNGARLASFMALGFIPAPETAYPDVRHLPPASLMTVRDGRVISERRYWKIPRGEVGRRKTRPLTGRALDHLHEALSGSLASRLLADVPLCLFGSNGVDSTMIAAICGRDLGADVEVLTVSFPNGQPDECEGAAAAAKQLGLSHRAVEVQDTDGAQWPSYYLDLFGQPNDNLSVGASYQLASAARSAGYIAGLTGIGGDEAFFGYHKQQLFWRRRRIYSAPQLARRMAGAAAVFARLSSDRAQLVLDLLAVPDSQRYLAVKNLPAFGLIRRLPGIAEWAEQTYGNFGLPIELQVPAIEREQIMPGSQLTSVDAGSMRASVELRSPFLSRSLFEAVAEFDPRAFLAFGQKSVGRRLLARYLPPDSILRGKRGFVFPARRLLEGAQPTGAKTLLPAGIGEEIWSRRSLGSGHERLAVRLALLGALSGWIAGAQQERSFAADAVPAAMQGSSSA
jgi:asparagine synthase (glutamine-hydrolysing)